MSRRGRHGRHPQPAVRVVRPAGPAQDAASVARFAPVTESIEIVADPVSVAPARPAETVARDPATAGMDPVTAAMDEDREREHLRAAPFRAAAGPAASPSSPGPELEPAPMPALPVQADAAGPRAGCTVAQLRRFIKSRPWVPMHELRRRFGIAGAEDEVTPVRVSERTLFIGLPGAEARMVAELLGGGDVGYELSLDPDVPVVVGVYPMRPVPRA